MAIRFSVRLLIVGIGLVAVSACSLNNVSARFASLFIKHEMASLNSEKNLFKVQRQLPKHIASLEKMILYNKKKIKLHIYAAQAYYSYAFAFVEDHNVSRATSLYYQAYKHASTALEFYGISQYELQGRTPQLIKKIKSLPKEAVGALYWTAVCWAKLIEIKQPDVMSFVQLHKTAILMKQVMRLHDSYHFNGAYMFFAVYYGSRPDYLGGNDFLARKYFDRARKLNNNRLLIVDYLQARYLNGRSSGEEKFIKRLQYIIQAPDDLYPEQTLMNAVAKQKASFLLHKGHI